MGGTMAPARARSTERQQPQAAPTAEATAASGAESAGARSLSPAELAYYAGLGVLAAVELIEWPVAVAVGAGTALARRSGGGGSMQSLARWIEDNGCRSQGYAREVTLQF